MYNTVYSHPETDSSVFNKMYSFDKAFVYLL